MLLDDLPRGVTGNRQQFSPLASWMDERALRQALGYDPRTGNRILLGHADGHALGVADDRHMLTVAGSRAGKGISAIIPNLIYYKGSILAIDPKGELAGITARRRAEGLKQRVFVLDPFGITPGWCAPYRKSYNPISILHPDSPTIIEDAGLIADALVIPSNRDAHWDESARTLIEGVLLMVATSRDFDGHRDMISFWQCIASGMPDMRGLRRYMLDSGFEVGGDIGYTIRAAADDFFERPPTERGSVLSTARRHVRFLGYPALRGVLKEHDFDLSDLKTAPEGMTIYLCVPAGRMGTCSRWFRLFINLTLNAMEQTRLRPAVPVLLLLDEFAILGHMRQIEDAAGQMAGFGVKLWPILQDLGQLRALYGDRWQTFMGNAGAMQLFGNNDVETMQYVSQRLGKTTIEVQSSTADRSQEDRLKGVSGASYSQQVHELIQPDEVARFFRRTDALRRQLIISPDFPAMIMQRFVYFDNSSENRIFRGLYDVLP